MKIIIPTEKYTLAFCGEQRYLAGGVLGRGLSFLHASNWGNEGSPSLSPSCFFFSFFHPRAQQLFHHQNRRRAVTVNVLSSGGSGEKETLYFSSFLI